jgi:hypothetical protein
MRRLMVPVLTGGLAVGLGALLSAPTSTADAPDGADPTPAATAQPGPAPSTSEPLGVASTAPDGAAAGSPEVSERGNVRKTVGEPAGLATADGEVFFQMSVDAAQLAATCPGRGVDVSPANGHFLVLDVTVTLSADAATSADPGQDVYMPLVAETFDVVGPGGALQETTVTDASWACFENDELLPPFLEPGQTASGKVVLDSANDSGVVVYAPDGAAGWEWEFGG